MVANILLVISVVCLVVALILHIKKIDINLFGGKK
jgi:hypothetical protein